MEYQLYAQVSAEIEEGQKEPGVWAKAFADAKGDEQKTKAIYIELMVERLALAQQSQTELATQSVDQGIDKGQVGGNYSIGDVKEYYPTGELMWRRQEKNGGWHGTAEKFHRNGQLSFRGNYKNRIPVGRHLEWDEKGKLISSKVY